MDGTLLCRSTERSSNRRLDVTHGLVKLAKACSSKRLDVKPAAAAVSQLAEPQLHIICGDSHAHCNVTRRMADDSNAALQQHYACTTTARGARDAPLSTNVPRSQLLSTLSAISSSGNDVRFAVMNTPRSTFTSRSMSCIAAAS